MKRVNQARQAMLGRHAIALIAFAALAASPALAQFGLSSQSGPQPDGPWLYFVRIFGLISTAAFGFAIGAFFSPPLKSARRIIWLVVAALLVLFTLFGPFPFADYAGGVVKIVAFIIAIPFGLRLGASAVKAAAAAEERKRPTSYGSAKWATFDYLKEHGLFGEAGFLLGEFASKNGRSPLRYNGARHLLTVAPTRGGKGVSSIIPNLLLHEGSALVIDPKGENALITARRRGTSLPGETVPGMNQDIVLLDPWDIAASTLGMAGGHFNPLDWIVEGDPDAAENAFIIADALVIKEPGQRDSDFWDEEAKALLTGIIYYVATAPEESEHRHLGRVRDILTMDDEQLIATLGRMRTHPHPMVRSTASRTKNKDVKLLSSVMASAQAHTHFLESPRIRESLSYSDFRFEDLKTERLTVYLILPADRLNTFNRWLRLMIQQAITVNARNITEKPDKPILFLLDEMPSLGRLPSIEQAYGLMAGFGMQLWCIVQDLSQLAKIYGRDGWQTFVSNSGVIQYMGSRDKMTADYFSALCGVTTIESHTISWAFNKAFSYATSIGSSSGQGGGSSSSNTTNTENTGWTRTRGSNEAQRQLAYADELMVLKGNQQIVFVENLDPIQTEKVVWYTDRNLKLLGVNLQPATTPARAEVPLTTLTAAALEAEPLPSVVPFVQTPPKFPTGMAPSGDAPAAAPAAFRTDARQEHVPPPSLTSPSANPLRVAPSDIVTASLVTDPRTGLSFLKTKPTPPPQHTGPSLSPSKSPASYEIKYDFNGPPGKKA